MIAAARRRAPLWLKRMVARRKVAAERRDSLQQVAVRMARRWVVRRVFRRAPLRWLRHLRRPFKGFIHWEWQLGPVVFQIKHHDHLPTEPEREVKRLEPLFRIYRDRYWRQS